MDADSRIAVLESLVEHLERHEVEQDVRIKAMEEDNARMRTDYQIYKLQLLFVAAVGASVGNQLLTPVWNTIVAYIVKGGP